MPLGILCGLSPTINAALNPLIQVFKPVSPLAWLPIVTMVVSAVYTSNNPIFEKSFLNSAITVTLCSLWPTLINTAIGVSSIDRDLTNVGRVLQLTPWTKVRKLVLPSALPYIFTALKVSATASVVGTIIGELPSGIGDGLGRAILNFNQYYATGPEKLWAAIFIAALLGITFFLIVAAVEAVVLPKTMREG